MRLVEICCLGHRPFGRLLSAALVNAVGFVGEQVVLGWLVLALTDSPLWVGVALGLRMAPLLVAGIPAGVLADRGDRLRLLRVSNLALAGASAVLGVLVWLDVAALWHILVVTFAAGCVRALDQTARQSLAHDLVGADRLVDALARLGIAARLGGLVGAVAVGALIARHGPGAGYLAVSIAYVTSVFVLPRGPALHRGSLQSQDSAWQGVVGFLGTMRDDPVLPLLMLLTAVAEILGFSHQTVLPSLARDVLAVGPQGLGAMNAARQVGGIVGIASVSRLGQLGGHGALLLAVLFAFGASVAALGVAPGYAGVLVILVVVNAMGAVADVLAQSLMQLSVPPTLRGRAGGAWVVAIGLAPLGQLQVGALTAWLGVGVALGISGAGLMILVGVATVLFPRLRRL